MRLHAQFTKHRVNAETLCFFLQKSVQWDKLSQVIHINNAYKTNYNNNVNTTYNIKYSHERVKGMLKQFERALATGQNLDTVRDELRRQADGVRLARYAEIDRAYNCCQLILFGITEPAGSVAGGIARGFVKQCKKDYYATKEGKEHRKLIRALNKVDDEPIKTKKKGKVNTDDPAHQKEQAQTAGEANDTDRSST